MSYILGIDQGGTKTAAAIIDETGNLSGIGYAKGAYFPAQSPELAVSEIKFAVNAALAQARLTIHDVHHIIAGITGVDYPGDDAIIRTALKQSFAADSIKDIHVYNDAVIALYSGTLEDYGLVVCAGTGLNMAICQKKNEYFVFGDYLGEELQGGSAIAHRGIRAVFDTKLGIRHAEKLTELFLRFSGVDTVGELLRLYMQDKDFQSRMRLIVPEMMELAISGDQDIDRLFREFAEELGIYIRAGLKNAGLLEKSVPLILTGSVRAFFAAFRAWH